MVSAVRGLSLLLMVLVLTSAAIGQATPPPEPDQAAPHGKILFSRDQDSPANEKSAKPPIKQTTVAVTDAERASLVFTAYDLDVHLAPEQSHLAVRTSFTLKNCGKEPLPRLVLQISSSLHWESFALRSGGRVSPLSFTEQTVDTDADHTGKAAEAIVSLPQPLEPGASVDLTSFYSGDVAQSAERLERIGAPLDQASRADWDRISPEWTGLRGFGSVLWYPTAAVPVFLGDGARLFERVGQTKQQQAAATIHLRLTVEYGGDPPDAAFFCGRREQLKAVSENQSLPVAESIGVATAEFSDRPLGFRTPSLFITNQAGTVTNDSLISAVTDHYDVVPSYDAAAEKVRPLLAEWLGPGPLSMLTILDHDGQPFEDDALLVAPLRESDTLAPALVHSLAHAWFRSSHAWLDEGVAQFMGLQWMEQSLGRETAVVHLQEESKALALVEPPPAKSADSTEHGQSLIQASDEVYYRTKAAAVLEMLRSIAGEDALRHAFQLYREDKMDSDPKEFQRVLERTSRRELGWFFDDWVYRDRGLPDLSIASVTPREIDQIGNKGSGWLVAVEVRNDGGAVAEVPVTVRSGTLTATQKLRIPSRSSASTRIVFEGTPTEVLVNDGTVPEVGSSIHSKQIVAH